MREAVAIPAEAKQAVLFLSSCQWAFVHRASTTKGIAEQLPCFVEVVYNKRRLHSALGYPSPQRSEDQHIRQTGQTAA